MDTNDHIRISITNGPLASLVESSSIRLAYEGAGAVLCFEGIVRPTEDGKPIVGIEYEAYEPMAQNSLKTLAITAIEKFGVLAIAVEHSKGMVPNRMCSFRLQVASVHRKEGLSAADWFIDAMKSDVPLWKNLVWSGAHADSEGIKSE